jgi:hypothetical protein
MGVAFVFAPLMAIVTAFVLAVLLGRGRRLR